MAIKVAQAISKPRAAEAFTPEEDRWMRLMQLFIGLSEGNLPLVTDLGGVHLEEGETAHAIVAAQRVEFYGTQETYTSGIGAIGGSGPFGLALLAATAGGSLLLGHASKRAAQKRAADQWRLVDQGNLIITNQRLAMQGQRQWLDIWYPQIRMSAATTTGFQLQLSEANPIAFLMGYSEWYYFLFQWLSNRRECRGVQIPDELKVKLGRVFDQQSSVYELAKKWPSR